MAKTRPKPIPKPSDNGKKGALHVSYGDVSIGDKFCRLGCVISRGNLTVAEADRQLCGRRLTVHCLARSSGGAGQESLPGIDGADIEFDGIADCKRYGVGPKAISFGLTFAIESIDIETLAKFAKREGVVTITNVAAIPAAEAGDGDAEE